MEIKWAVIIVVFLSAIALIVYLIKRNEKDKKDLEKFLNETEVEEEPVLEEKEEK